MARVLNWADLEGRRGRGLGEGERKERGRREVGEVVPEQLNPSRQHTYTPACYTNTIVRRLDQVCYQHNSHSHSQVS